MAGSKSRAWEADGSNQQQIRDEENILPAVSKFCVRNLAIKGKRKNESVGEATVTPPVSKANRRVGFVVKSFNGFGLRRLDSQLSALTFKLVSIGIGCFKDVVS